jgi:hypothetical protein
MLSILGRIFLFIFILFSSVNCKKNVTIFHTVYQENFEDGIANNIKVITGMGQPYGTIVRPFGGSNVCGMFNNTLFTLEVDDLPSHNMIYVGFDFYAHDGWEGNKVSSNGIVDVWNIRVNGEYQLSTTFSNTPAALQAYPEWIGTSIPNPPKGNASDTLLYGFCLWDKLSNGTTKYRVVFSRPHTDRFFRMELNDALQGSPCQKSWSVDNIQVKTITN